MQPSPGLRTRVPRRGTAPAGVAREVPPARRPPGPAHDRAGVDRARPAAARLLHEAHGGGVAARRPRRRRARGTLPGMVRTGRDVRRRVAEEYLRYLEHDRQRKPSTLRDSRSMLRNHLLPAFGDAAARGHHGRRRRALGARARRDQPSWRTARKHEDHRDLPRRDGARAAQSTELPANPVADVEKPAHGAADGDDRRLLARGGPWRSSAPPTYEQDAAIFLTAAFTGLRQGELVALRWRDVDFAGAHIRVTRELHAAAS